MHARTRALHARAEQSGVVALLLSRAATRAQYGAYLANLLPAYVELEAGLAKHRNVPEISPLANPLVFRAAMLESDLRQIVGVEWRSLFRPLPVASQYAHRIRDAAQGSGALLIAHAYVRYLGDLNGGRILKRLVGDSLNLADAALRFYEFSEPSSTTTLSTDYRHAIDRAAESIADVQHIVEEAAKAFELNIALSQAVANL